MKAKFALLLFAFAALLFGSEPLTKLDRSEKGVTFYRKNNGSVIGIGSDFFIKAARADQLPALLSDYNLTLKKRYGDRLFLVASDSDDMPALMGVLENDDRIEKAYLNFHRKPEIR